MENTTLSVDFLGEALDARYAPISDIIYSCEMFVKTQSKFWFGHFMTSVLNDKLFDAVSYADTNSRNNLPLIVEFLQNEGSIVRGVYYSLR